MKIPLILVGGGFIVSVLAFFPLTITAWLGRDTQLLIGCMALMLGAALVHFDTRETA